MKKAISLSVLLLMVSMLVMAAGTTGSWTGTINDVGCAKAGKAHDAACVQKCMAGGAKAALMVGKEIYTITNAAAIKGHEGHNVKLTGSLDQDKMEITVDKVEMVKQ